CEATLAPSLTSVLLLKCSASTARKAASDSLTPPLQDSISLLTSWRKPRMSLARSAVDGRCTSATATAAIRNSTPANNSHRGVRRTGQPLCRADTRSRSLEVMDGTCRSASIPIHERDALGQILCRQRPDHVQDDPVL